VHPLVDGPACRHQHDSLIALNKRNNN